MVSVGSMRDTPHRRSRSLGTGAAEVFWIGGGPGAGKSTLARGLADRYGLRRMATDDTMGEHARRLDPAQAPHLQRFLAMDMDERWLNRSPAEMLDSFHWFRGEGFDLIVDDLLRLPSGPPVVVEGLRVLPHLVAPLLPDADHAVWLLPSPEFREAALTGRAEGRSIPEHTSDPARAARNLAQRDALFTERLTDETDRLGLHTIRVTSAVSESDLLSRIALLFGLQAPR